MRTEQRGAAIRRMNRTDYPLRLGCAAAACLMCAAAGAQSLFDNERVGFTELQAIRGEAAYRERCAGCHGPNLDDGQFAGPLKGAAFEAHWHDQPPALPVTR